MLAPMSISLVYYYVQWQWRSQSEGAGGTAVRSCSLVQLHTADVYRSNTNNIQLTTAIHNTYTMSSPVSKEAKGKETALLTSASAPTNTTTKPPSVQLSSSATNMAIKTDQTVKTTTVAAADATEEEDTASEALAFDKLGENDVVSSLVFDNIVSFSHTSIQTLLIVRKQTDLLYTHTSYVRIQTHVLLLSCTHSSWVEELPS